MPGNIIFFEADEHKKWHPRSIKSTDTLTGTSSLEQAVDNLRY